MLYTGNQRNKTQFLWILLTLVLLLGTLQIADAASADMHRALVDNNSAQQTVSNVCTANVPDASDYTLVYHLEIPENSDYNNSPVPYAVDNSAAINGFRRVAYCLQLVATDTAAAVIFEHPDYAGKSQVLVLGWNPGPLEIGNDVVSSVKVAPGYRVTLYEDDQSRGRTLVLTEDTPDLIKLNFNDITSNIMVEKINTLDGNSNEQWVWVSMDDFTNDTIAHTGVPIASANPNGFQRNVANMNVFSNVPGVQTGKSITTGNIEFWDDCYDPPAQLGLAGASNVDYDFDDTRRNDDSCYGSMQVHNHTQSGPHTIFAYNGWEWNGSSRVDETGIGKQATGHPDWTFSNSAANYTTRNLWIYVDPGCTADQFEPNNSFEEAAAIQQGSYPGLQKCYRNPDYFSIPLAIGEVIDLSIQFDRSKGDLDLHLYNANKELVASGTPSSNNEMISYTAQAGGTHYFKVDDGVVETGEGGIGGVENDYNLQISVTSPGPQHADCSQADFLAKVQAGESSGTMTLDGSCRYVLSSASDSWNGGSGAILRNTTVVEGNGAIIERSANAPKFRIFALQVQAGTVMRNVTIRNGASTAAGGGIFVNSSVTLENVTLEGNTADNNGGAIYSQQNLVLHNVTIKDSVGAQGGAIASLAGELTIDNSHLINNHAKDYGGAIFKQAGSLDVTDTIFAQNHSDTGNGAALFIGGDVIDAKMTNSTITDNAGNLGKAIVLWSPFTLRNTIIANHSTALLAGKAVSEDYNLFANTTVEVQEVNGAVVNRGGHSTQVPDPQFVAAVALNYTLKKSSPAVDRGMNEVLASAPNLAKDAANLGRPFSGTKVDIGAYELQAEGGPSLSIVKRGPPWLAAGSTITYSLTIANDGIRSGESLEVVDVLPVGAEYIPNSATANGVFANGRLTWQIGTLAPGQRKFFQYSVKALQALVSADYRVQSTSDPSVIAQGKVITSPLNSKIVAAMNFFPQPDGFSFPNYGSNDSPDSDLTAEDVAFIFGKEVVCKSQNPCVLTATAEAWRKTWLKTVEGGHCAGMAMGSLNIFANATFSPSDLQPGANFLYDLTKAKARKYIALYATTQGSPPKNSSTLQQNGYEWNPATTPVDVLKKLIANLGDPKATDRYGIAFFKHSKDGGGGGHAVTPFAVETFNADEDLIYIYDNNYPNQFDRAIRINRSTGAWKYVGTTNPDVPVVDYRGDATSNNLILISWQWAHSFPKDCTRDSLCSTGKSAAQASAGNLPGANAPQSSGTVEFQLDGEGYLLVTRSDGKQVGFNLTTGEWISEIEGAQAVDVLTGLGFNTPPAIYIPHEAGMTYGIQIGNRKTAFGNTEAPANVNISGAGFAIRLTNLVLNSPVPQPIPVGEAGSVQTAGLAAGPTDLMNLNIDPVAKRVTFAPGVDDAEAPSLSLAISKADGSDYSVDVKNVNVEKGHAVALAFDAASQSITIEDNSAGQTDFQVEVTRINTDGSQNTFVSDSVSDGGKAGVTLKVGAEWTGEAPAIQVEEQSTLLAPGTGNQGNKVFLPITMR